MASSIGESIGLKYRVDGSSISDSFIHLQEWDQLGRLNISVFEYPATPCLSTYLAGRLRRFGVGTFTVSGAGRTVIETGSGVEPVWLNGLWLLGFSDELDVPPRLGNLDGLGIWKSSSLRLVKTLLELKEMMRRTDLGDVSLVGMKLIGLWIEDILARDRADVFLDVGLLL